MTRTIPVSDTRTTRRWLFAGLLVLLFTSPSVAQLQVFIDTLDATKFPVIRAKPSLKR